MQYGVNLFTVCSAVLVLCPQFWASCEMSSLSARTPVVAR